MTIPELVMWATVLFVGIPSAWRNPTAAALVMAWFAGQAFYLVTGNNLPVELYLMPDILVLAVIFSKPEACDLRPYRGTLHQLRCMVLERSPADRVILAIFVVMWAIYPAAIHPFYKWYLLLALCITQFLAAGIEALSSHGRDADVADQPDPPGFLLVAYRSGAYG
jgi:hypothetical protein